MDIEKFCGLLFKGLTFEAVLFLKYFLFPKLLLCFFVCLFYNLIRLKQQCFDSEVLDVHAGYKK